MDSNLGMVIIVLISLVVYFIPTTTAMARGHHNFAAILVLNLFLGWTFIGWVVALIWASTAIKR